MRNTRRWLAGSLALATAWILSPTTWAPAFTLTGTNLVFDQRDVRVFDNFTDSSANDNTTADPEFPGATGAELAIWKAVVEWQCDPHGTGGGDPHQPGGLGSSGSNFGPTWQGLANGVGGTGDNVCSSIAGSGGGISAFLETGPAGGWRMRFYEAETWEDGPGVTLAPGRLDLQAVATHLYGRALGLGTSSVAGATMSSPLPSGVDARSIEVDDALGLRAIYGVASPSRPVIFGVTTVPGSITITGVNFGATGNEVWFTRVAPNTTGEPVKALGVPSTGTSITLALPIGVGPGDVLVRAPGAGNDRLSSAFPFAPDCPAPTNVCQTAPNSVDPIGARMTSSGSTSITTNDFVLRAFALPPGTNGRFFFGPNPTLAPFGNGFRCVGSPSARLPVVAVDGTGNAAQAFDVSGVAPVGSFTPGAVIYAQFWYRNVLGGGAGFNLSDALRVVLCP